MTDQELASALHRDISENPKFTKQMAKKKYGAHYKKLTRLEQEGLIPRMYVMTKQEIARATKKANRGWHRGEFRL